MQELSLKSGGGRNFGRGRNLGRVRYAFWPILRLEKRFAIFNMQRGSRWLTYM